MALPLPDDWYQRIDTAFDRMLRITCSHADGTALLKVEGRLAGKWIGELASAVENARREAAAITLDLSDVAFVDHDGANLLLGLRRDGVELAACSSFVSGLINRGLA